MKAWSPGVAVTDLLLSNLSADLYESKEAAAAWKEVEELANRGKTQFIRQDRASRGPDISRK